MWKTYVNNEQRWIRNRVIHSKRSFYSNQIEKAYKFINIYREVAGNRENYKSTSEYDAYYDIQNMIKVAQQCRRYLLDNGSIVQINSAVKQISNSFILWFFTSTFNPYCGAYDIVEHKIETGEKGIFKKIDDLRYLYYEPFNHDLCYYKPDQKCFIPTKRFYNHPYLEKCRRHIRYNIAWEIIDIR